MTWLVLGLLAVLAVAAVVMDRRREVQTDRRIADAVAGVRNEKPGREPVQLDEEQLRDLRVAWGHLTCPSCGNVHPGVCVRVKEIRFFPNGSQERIIYWPDGEWELPEGTISPWDVFGTVAPPQPEEEKDG